MAVVPRAISVAIMAFYLENAACLVANQTTRKLEAGKQKTLLIGQLQDLLAKDFGVVMDDKQIRTHWQNKKSQIIRKAKEYLDRRSASRTQDIPMDDSLPVIFDCPTEQRVLNYLMTAERSSFERGSFNDSKPHLLFASRKRSINIKDEEPDMDFKFPKLEDFLAGTLQSFNDAPSSETPDASPNKLSNLETLLASTNASDGFANSPLKTPFNCPSSPVVDMQQLLTSIVKEELAQNSTGSVPCLPVVGNSMSNMASAVDATAETSRKEALVAIQSLDGNVLQEFLRNYQAANAKLYQDFSNLEGHMPAVNTLIHLQKNALKHQEAYLQAVLGMVSSTTHLVNTVAARLAKDDAPRVQHSSVSKGSVDSVADGAIPCKQNRNYGHLMDLQDLITPYSPMTSPFAIPSYPLPSHYYVPTPFGTPTNAYFPSSIFNSLCSQTTSNVCDGKFLRPDSTVAVEANRPIVKSFNVPRM